MAQVDEDDLNWAPDERSNSIATIVQHVGGNLASRFTEFLTADGEKPWRDRDTEFLAELRSSEELATVWERGWSVLENALAELRDDDLGRTVHIRAQPLSVVEALNRSLSHVAYHVGQIVYLARQRAEAWESLSVPVGGSGAFNQRMRDRHRPAE